MHVAQPPDKAPAARVSILRQTGRHTKRNGGLHQKLDALKAKADGVQHFGRDNQIKQLECVIADPSLVTRIKNELLHLHIPFTRLEFIRVAIAKHEVSGKAKAAALMPGYGRINMYCGSLDYQMDSGKVILGTINRRDLADSFRNIDCSGDLLTADVDCISRQRQQWPRCPLLPLV